MRYAKRMGWRGQDSRDREEREAKRALVRSMTWPEWLAHQAKGALVVGMFLALLYAVIQSALQ